ncbi:serine protease inhibitor [Cyanobium sp. ATX 6F1]|uniref:serine protease inhibitor n=1 Tax=unclassified Cyanobium TaxID=2627006 RepID=UPI0020CC932A|nr:serine protease inhibitor [Cyanobium sp. ATX 6F1]MCP9917056.1 serine protease inhibitor [Cyanobium sp. ATX 6F1]
MTASCFSTAHVRIPVAMPAARPVVRRHRGRQPQAFAAGTGTTALGLALVLMLVAALVAPEQPGEQASICQRHNGAAACRVW